MAGYVIHLAVGKVYEQNNKIDDLKKFEDGILAPDMVVDKSKSHYGLFSSQPELERFIREHGISSSYDEGYFLHLVTDYLFYGKFLNGFFSPVIYDDYDRLNRRIVEKYEIEVPQNIQSQVLFVDGEPTILSEKGIYRFINSVGRIKIREIIKQIGIDIESNVGEKFDTEFGDK